MTKSEKKKFLRDLTKSVLTSALAKVDAMPAEWDGQELRHYLADKFAESTYTMDGARKRAYRNTVLVSNL